MTLSITYIGAAIGILASILALIDAIRRRSKYRYLKAMGGALVIIVLSILLQREANTTNSLVKENPSETTPNNIPANNQPPKLETQTIKTPEKTIEIPVHSKKVERDSVQSSNRFIADYLIISSIGNQFEEMLPDIQTAIEEKGYSATIQNVHNYSFTDLQGKYKSLVVANAKLEYKSSSIDSRMISASYYYTIKIYNVDTRQSEILTDNGSDIGFSEMEASGKVKQKLRDKIKSSI